MTDQFSFTRQIGWLQSQSRQYLIWVDGYRVDVVGVGIGKYSPANQNIWENNIQTWALAKFKLGWLDWPRACLHHKLHGPEHWHSERPDRTGVPEKAKCHHFYSSNFRKWNQYLYTIAELSWCDIDWQSTISTLWYHYPPSDCSLLLACPSPKPVI